jgi:hypothetical protein
MGRTLRSLTLGSDMIGIHLAPDQYAMGIAGWQAAVQEQQSQRAGKFSLEKQESWVKPGGIEARLTCRTGQPSLVSHASPAAAIRRAAIITTLRLSKQPRTQ